MHAQIVEEAVGAGRVNHRNQIGHEGDLQVAILQQQAFMPDEGLLAVEEATLDRVDGVEQRG